jgi:hypothetical protein
MSVEFTGGPLESVFGRRQQIGLRYENTFGQGVSGLASLHVPAEWSIAPAKTPIKVGAGERRDQPLAVALRSDASTGVHEVRVDFEVVADRPYRFSVHRPLQVGLGDVEIEMTSRLNERGELVVEQQLINRRDTPVSFNCQLFAPQRQRIRRPVFSLYRGQVKLTYILPEGRELIGQSLLLRAEEIGGPRVLNFRHVVE